MMALYSLALAVGLLVASPWWLVRMLTTDRYREGLAQRLGFVPPALLIYVRGHKTIWLHAVSVGEVLAASRLITELEAALGAEYRVVISTTTKAGQHLARERFGAERVFYMPLDFAYTTRRYLGALQPAALILTESELWPRLLTECNACNIPVAVINARVSDRSFTRGVKFRAIWKSILRKPTLLLAQSDQDAQRLVAMGAPAMNVQNIGNLKYDVRQTEERPLTKLLRERATGRRIIVAGSTHFADRTNEEEIILAAMSHVWERYPNTLLVIAPRHPQRFTTVERLAAERGSTITGSAVQQSTGPLVAKTLVLDTIGDLASIYSLATVAIIGGSFVWNGGHNPLEPAQFGVPIIMGFSFENFRDVVTRMIGANALCIANDVVELRDTLLSMLDDPASARASGDRARGVFEAEAGATARTVEAIVKLVRP